MPNVFDLMAEEDRKRGIVPKKQAPSQGVRITQAGEQLNVFDLMALEDQRKQAAQRDPITMEGLKQMGVEFAKSIPRGIEQLAAGVGGLLEWQGEVAQSPYLRLLAAGTAPPGPLAKK